MQSKEGFLQPLSDMSKNIVVVYFTWLGYWQSVTWILNYLYSDPSGCSHRGGRLWSADDPLQPGLLLPGLWHHCLWAERLQSQWPSWGPGDRLHSGGHLPGYHSHHKLKSWTAQEFNSAVSAHRRRQPQPFYTWNTHKSKWHAQIQWKLQTPATGCKSQHWIFPHTAIPSQESSLILKQRNQIKRQF